MRGGEKTLLGIDLGTSSVKVALFDADGRRLAGAQAAYPLDAPHPGWAETSPDAWWAAVCAAVREVTAAADRDVGAVGLSGQMHGLVLVDGRGAPVRPAITWADTRAAGLQPDWARLAPTVLERLGNPFSPGMAGVLLGWLARHEPATLRAAAVALQPKDYLRLRLTGIAATEHTDASATLLYDLTGRAWLTGLAAGLGIDPGLLPPINEAAEIAGPLTADAAADLGLRAGIPVAHGLADTAAAMLGSGLVTPGAVQLTLGTGGQFVTPVAAPAPAATSGSPAAVRPRRPGAGCWPTTSAGGGRRGGAGGIRSRGGARRRTGRRAGGPGRDRRAADPGAAARGRSAAGLHRPG
ncbi:FGGY family carbohydrate kinase [Cryobacterium sp. HLT2-28]|uniref:FGGY family carbohydrate kinase n=1 Tax=Cryobacterium sp. HLT2-28 TaxID=1259146 RepID=UPI00141B36A3|nr:FGGY family carbohydrate kinase [Cryobacterium sp. HLT2-28]